MAKTRRKHKTSDSEIVQRIGLKWKIYIAFENHTHTHTHKFLAGCHFLNGPLKEDVDDLETTISKKDTKPDPLKSLRPYRQTNDDDGFDVTTKDTLRWGIAPVGRIAHDFAQALSILPRNQHRLVACAASYKSQADEFANKFNLMRKYTNFLELAQSNEIDVVYVAPLTPMHLEIGRLMLDNGKHVLCETPFCLNENQAIQMIGHSHFKGRFLMEGQWSRFLPSYGYIREVLQAGVLGEICELQCTFGTPMTDLERMTKRSLGGGVTLELGPSAIQLALWIYRMQPYNIHATGVLNEDGVDTAATIELDFCCGRKATISLTSEHSCNNCARITGHKGVMTIPNYWCPTEIVDSNGLIKHFDIPEDENLHATNYPRRLGMCYEAEEVRRCIQNNKSQSSVITHNETLMIQRICDEVRRQLGVVYEEDASCKSNQIQPDAFSRLHEHITI